MGKGTVSGGSPIAWVKYLPFLIGLQVRLPGSDHVASSPFSILNQPIYTPQRKLEAKSARSLQYQLLKRNKNVCILSIAVTTLLYITATYDYHIRYVHCACPQGSGRNSYQTLCIKSGEFWRVLGHPHVRHH